MKKVYNTIHMTHFPYGRIEFIYFSLIFQVGQTNIARRQEKQATREARFAIAPFLQAEEDLRYVVARRNGEIHSECLQVSGHLVPSKQIGALERRGRVFLLSLMSNCLMIRSLEERKAHNRHRTSTSTSPRRFLEGGECCCFTLLLGISSGNK